MSGVALITGSSRGIGAATARLAASRGWAVAVNYLLDGGSAELVARDVRAAGARAIIVQADTADEADVARMFRQIDDELGPLTSLVNNAGITGLAGRLESYDAAAIRRVLDVSVVGSLLCAKEAVKRMSTKTGGKGGTIVNLSSLASQFGGGNQWIPYAAAKGAVNSLTLGLAREYADEGIRVNALLPGLIDTEIHASAGAGDRLQHVIPQVPMKRAGTAEECAEAIVWLMSGEAGYMTAALIPMGGGR